MNIDVVLNALLAPGELARLAVQAEACGVGAVWTASYLASRDPWSNLVAAAQATRRIGLGAIAVNPYDTHPVRIATGLLTLNEYAGGRARIVVGGGGEALQALGIKPERRVRAVGECVQILKGVTPGVPFSFQGGMYSVQNYNPSWASAPKPPVYVAVNKPQMLRMAARAGDGIMLSDLTPAICAERIGWVKNHLWLGYRGLFRRWVLNTFMSDADYDVIEAHKAEIYGMVPSRTWSIPGVPDALLDTCVNNLTLAGTPADIPRFIEHLRKMQRAGCTDIVLELHDDPAEGIRLIGEQVIPALNGEAK